MKSKNTMFSSNNDSSIGPDSTTYRSMMTTTKQEKSGKMLETSQIKKDKDAMVFEEESSTMMSLDSTIDVASIDIFSLARHGRF